MQYKRYGNFRFADYIGSWVGIALYLIFTILVFFVDLSPFFAVFAVIMAGITALSILLPHRERFSLENGKICVKKGKKAYEIVLPERFLLVFSPIDLAPPFGQRSATQNGTHILKGQYGVTILQPMPTDKALALLHRGYLREFTTCSVRACLCESQVIYSFACHEELLQKLIAHTDTQIIVPKTLNETLGLDGNNVYIDTKC